MAFLLAFAAAQAVRPLVGADPGAGGSWQTDVGSAQNAVLAFAALLACLAARGHYRERLAFWTEARDITALAVFALLGACFLEFAFRSNSSRLVVMGVWLAYPAVAVPLRQAAKKTLTSLRLWQIPVVLVGDKPGLAHALALFQSEPIAGYGAVGLVRADAVATDAPGNWLTILTNAGAEQIVFALSVGSEHERRLIPSVVRERVPFAVISQAAGLPVFGCERTPFFNHDAVMFSYHNNLAQPLARAVKLTFDLAIAALLLLLLAPVLLLIALLIRCDGGPALYAHPRVGFGGRRFSCVKFRTMVTNADAVLDRLLSRDHAAAGEWAVTRKLRDDPRVTWIGRVLRRTSLDELPQLFNVLRLEMSLVGPRPIVEDEVARYAQDIGFYFEARPGLTGLWQVSGRSETSYARRVQLDCWYVKNWTVWYDVAILMKTLPVVLGRRGAR